MRSIAGKQAEGVVDTSISGRRVVRELTDLIAERGKPKIIVSDNGDRADLERGARLVRRCRR